MFAPSASTFPSRPARLKVRSVSSPTIRTVSARSKRLPVDEHGAVEELLELGQRHPGVLRDRLGREVAADPRLFVSQVGLVRHPGRRLANADPLGRDVRSCPRVLRRDDRDVGIRVLDFEALDLGEGAEDIERRLADELAADGVEAEADERADPASAELAAHLLDERAARRLRADKHLPPRLGGDAVDEEARVRLDPRVDHAPIIPCGPRPAAHRRPRLPLERWADDP
jgi:hypothetical protein